MDAQLADRLMSTVGGEVLNKLRLQVDRKLAEKKRQRGRVIAKMILDYYQVEGLDSDHTEKQRFLNIRLKGDNVKVYWHDWDTIVGCIKPENLPSETEIEIKARRGLKKAHALQNMFIIYNMKTVHEGQPRSLSLLRKMMQ